MQLQEVSGVGSTMVLLSSPSDNTGSSSWDRTMRGSRIRTSAILRTIMVACFQSNGGSRFVIRYININHSYVAICLIQCSPVSTPAQNTKFEKVCRLWLPLVAQNRSNTWRIAPLPSFLLPRLWHKVYYHSSQIPTNKPLVARTPSPPRASIPSQNNKKQNGTSFSSELYGFDKSCDGCDNCRSNLHICGSFQQPLYQYACVCRRL